MEILEILAWIGIAAVVTMGFFIVFVSPVIEFIYRSLFTEKRFNLFLQKIERDPLLKPLLKEIRLRNIRLVPFGLFDEFLLRRGIGMTAIPMEIAISNSEIKQFLAGKLNPKLVALALAHELEHIISLPKREICKYHRDCLYQELRATKEGCRRLEKITEKGIRKIFPEKHIRKVLRVSRKQCKKCIKKGILQNKCPEAERLKKMGVEIHNKKIRVRLSVLFS